MEWGHCVEHVSCFTASAIGIKEARYRGSERPQRLLPVCVSGSLYLRRIPVACVFITAVPIIKLFAWGEGDSGGHVLRETTSRGLRGLVCPSLTSESGGKVECVKEGGGRRRGARERACIGGATTPQPWILRFIFKAAALAAASPTWIFSGWWNAACLKRNDSDWLRCDGTPVAVKCAWVSRWACRKRRRKNSPCMRVDVLVMAGIKEMF